MRSSQPFSYDTFPFSLKCSVNVFSFCFVLGFFVFGFFSLEHPGDSFENNRYIFSDSEEGCNESDFAVGKSCLSKYVFYFCNLLHLLGHFSGFHKFPEDMKAGFIQKKEGKHLTDFLICFKC